MTRGNTYRHISCLDVDMYVLSVGYRGPEYSVVKFVWTHRVWGITYADSAKRIYHKDLWKWSPV